MGDRLADAKFAEWEKLISKHEKHLGSVKEINELKEVASDAFPILVAEVRRLKKVISDASTLAKEVISTRIVEMEDDCG